MPLTERCKTCLYFCDNVNHFMYPTCDYILRAGHMRGCPSGDECTKYFPKKGGVKLANPMGCATHLAVSEQTLLDLYMQGKTDVQISKETGVSVNSVARWRRKNGFPSQQALSRSVENED